MSRNVVITGASRGIGHELLKLAIQDGHRVLAVARKFTTTEGLSDHLKLDLKEATSAAKIADAVKSWGRIDLLINNAGILRESDRKTDFMDSFEVNSVAPYLITKALLPLLKTAPSPKVVHLTSLMGSIQDNLSGGYYAYRASKAALNMINMSLTKDHPWLTTAVLHPGWVKTEMGGPNAPVSPEESAHGLWKVIQNLQQSQSGSFIDYTGRRLPW